MKCTFKLISEYISASLNLIRQLNFVGLQSGVDVTLSPTLPLIKIGNQTLC